MNRQSLVLGGFLAALMCCASVDRAATYLVSTRGSDSSAGSEKAPWRTLQYAAGKVRPGDCVKVEPGSYAGFTLRTSGAADQPICFHATNNARIDQSTPLHAGIAIAGASNVTIEGFALDGAKDPANARIAIDVHAEGGARPRNVVIRKTLVEHWSESGISCADASDLLLEANSVHDIGSKAGGAGILLVGVQHANLVNNLVYNVHAFGITLERSGGDTPSTRTVLVNNTVVQAADGLTAFNVGRGCAGNVVFNNIFGHRELSPSAGGIGIAFDCLADFTCEQNVFSLPLRLDGKEVRLGEFIDRVARGKNNFVVSHFGMQSLFRNEGHNNFRVAPGSLLIDNGVRSVKVGDTSYDAPRTDLMGDPRRVTDNETPDIGVFEYRIHKRPPNPVLLSLIVGGLALAAIVFERVTRRRRLKRMYGF